MTDSRSDSFRYWPSLKGLGFWHRREATLRAKGCDLQLTGDHRVVGWRRDYLRSSIMTRISERQSLTREEKFVPLVHLYAELRLPFDAALDAAEADLLHEQNKGPKETARRSGMSPDGR